MAEALHLGLTGWPLDHSLSPVLHQAALQAHGLAGEYRLYPVPPDPHGAVQLKTLLERMRLRHIDGLNVTIPHKQAVLPWLDALTPVAAATGAANTIFRDVGCLTGDNTDAPAFMADLMKIGGDGLVQDSAGSPRALVLGSGGAARAVTVALAQAGWMVAIAARSPSKAQALVEHLNTSMANDPVIPALNSFQLDIPSLEAFLDEIGSHPLLIVNTTPLGMLRFGAQASPEASATPWPEAVKFPNGALVYDLVYNPPVTPFIRLARQAGLPAYNGLGMLVEQAVLSFVRWAGLPGAGARQVTRAAMVSALAQIDFTVEAPR